MDLRKIFYVLKNKQNPPSASVPDRQIQSMEAISSEPKYISDIVLNELLGDTGRRKNNTSGDGHNNCGFNAILEQVGDGTHAAEMVDLLRHKLGYNDAFSGEMFDSSVCLSVANFFKHPVAEIYHNDGKIAQLSFSIPGIDLGLYFKGSSMLSSDLTASLVNDEWNQERVDTLSQWAKTNLFALNFGQATMYDIVLQMLQYPRTIVLVSVESGGHFDAAPHKDRQQEDSVLEFLRGAKS